MSCKTHGIWETMSPKQSRAARAWLGWSQGELAKRAGVGQSTVQDFERGWRTPIANNIAAIRRVIEGAGVRLLFDEDGEAAGIAAGDTSGELSRSRSTSRR
jgi:transcriptional regulator with XRE-family HTH domain